MQLNCLGNMINLKRRKVACHEAVKILTQLPNGPGCLSFGFIEYFAMELFGLLLGSTTFPARVLWARWVGGFRWSPAHRAKWIGGDFHNAKRVRAAAE